MNGTFDAVIGGGGPVGLAVACALHESGHRILLIEPRAGEAASDDPRAIAISHGSRLLLEQLGAWSAMQAATAITTIHVSQRGGFGRSQMTARECGLPALGYVARYGALHQSLASSLDARAAGSDWFSAEYGARITAVDYGPDHVELTIQSPDQRTVKVQTRLLILADGGSTEALVSGATTRTVDYQQSALVATVRAPGASGGVAYERFTPEGPIALLPHDHALALVWTTSPRRAIALASLDEPAFLEQLHEYFGDRVGRFTEVTARATFPLSLRSTSVSAQRVALIGNASQTLHPVAGQGFNLGLRDAWELAQLLNLASPDTVNVPDLVRTFTWRRRADRETSKWLTHSLIRLFAGDKALAIVTRGAALAGLDLFAPARRAFARQMAFGIRSGF
jgi:2-octaprenyl-6-methoxyphenol hydroxylase